MINYATPPVDFTPPSVADTPIAARIAVTTCAHGTVWLHLMDADGVVFAAAPMTVLPALNLAKDVLHRTADVLRMIGMPAQGTA